MTQQHGSPRRHILGQLVESSRSGARILQWLILAVGVAAGLAFLGVVLQSLQPSNLYRKDILQEYLMARALADGNNPLLPIQVLGEQYLVDPSIVLFPHPTPHPPTAGLLFLPFSVLDYFWAAAIWLGLELACLAASVGLIIRGMGFRSPLWATPVIMTALLAFHPIYEDLYDGQLMIVLLMLLVGARQALLSGHRWGGGALIGLAVLIKLMPWPLLLLLAVRKDWRALSGGVFTILLGYGLTAWVIGLDAIVSYFTEILPPLAQDYSVISSNLSVWTLGPRVFQGTKPGVTLDAVTVSRTYDVIITPLGYSPLAGQILSAVAVLVVLLLALKAVHNQPRLDPCFGIFVCVSVLLSPIAWSHYLVLTLIPLAQTIGWLIRQQWPRGHTNLAIPLALLIVPQSEWVKLGRLLAGQPLTTEMTTALSFAPGLVTLVLTILVMALALFMAILDVHPNLPDASKPCKRVGASE